MWEDFRSPSTNHYDRHCLLQFAISVTHPLSWVPCGFPSGSRFFPRPINIPVVGLASLNCPYVWICVPDILHWPGIRFKAYSCCFSSAPMISKDIHCWSLQIKDLGLYHNITLYKPRKAEMKKHQKKFSVRKQRKEEVQDFSLKKNTTLL